MPMEMATDMEEEAGLSAAAFWLPLASAVLAAAFLCLLPFSALRQRDKSYRVRQTWDVRAKLCLALAVPGALLGSLVAAVRMRASDDDNGGGGGGTAMPAVAAGLSLAANIGVCWLLFAQRRHSPRPSGLVLAYLLASVVCDLIWVLAPGPSVYSSWTSFLTLFTLLSIVLKALVLALESRGRSLAISLDAPGRDSLAPEETAGLVRGTLFWWINPILVEGSRRVLSMRDVPPAPPEVATDLRREAIMRAWDGRAQPETKATLPLVLLRSLAAPFTAAVAPRLFLVAFRYGQPILIQQTIRFVSEPLSEPEARVKGFWVMVMAAFVYLGLAATTATYQQRLSRLRVMIRGSLISLVYARLLRVQADGYHDGSAVTLMSADCDNLSGTAEMLLELLGHALEVAVGMFMLSRHVRWLPLVPLVLIFFASRVSRYVALNLRPRQKAWTEATQARMAAVAGMLASMKSIKALGLSETVSELVEGRREHEIAQAQKLRWIQVAYNASANALGIFTPAITMIIYSVLAKTGSSAAFDAETAFTTIAILSMVTHPANMIMTIVPRAVACMASFERIQTYLVESTREDRRTVLTDAKTTLASRQPLAESGHAIKLEHVSVETLKGSGGLALDDVSLSVERGHLAVCSGPVGSGKSVLARVVLGETPVSAGGVVEVATRRIGFCAQSAWLPQGRLRDVVVCGAPAEDVDMPRYVEALRACCLHYDIGLLPDGDETEVGSRGINLSGGQRQRIALARLLYARPEIAILDDSFSALDGKTESAVVQNILGPDGVLRQLGTTVLWLTSSPEYAHLADHVILLSHSKIVQQGPFESLRLELTRSVKSKGGHQDEPAEEPKAATVAQGLLKLQSQKRAADDAAADISRKTGDFSLYGFYVRYAGPLHCLVLVLCCALYSFFGTFPNYWLKWWTDDASPDREWFYVVGYALLVLTAWISTDCIAWATHILVAATSGAALHQLLLRTVIGAPLSYFSATDSGVILNRFSQDMQLVDTDLPTSAQSLIVQICKLVVQMSLLLSVQRFILFSLPLCLAVVYVVQKYYLQTSRQLRLLDLESKSSVFSSFLETVEGIVTIRAFGWEAQAERATLRSLDLSQRAAYLLACLQRWLNLVLDLTVAGVALSSIAAATARRGATSGGAVGVALNVVIVANATLLSLVRAWTNLEISLGAIARLKGAAEHTPVEDRAGEVVDPRPGWPARGAVELVGVSASYNEHSKNVLHDITLSIQPGQKVVICGRTGSGKSTLLLALLRLVEPTGTIRIDGVDASSVRRAALRERCFVAVPQDPFLVPDRPLRYNVDPAGALPDGAVAAALRKVRLWEHLAAGCGPGSDSTSAAEAETEALLDRSLASLPPLSAGQTQLVALARAIAKREALQTSGAKPILLLDEATSALDPDAEAVMQAAIDDEFVARGHTVVMVTHRPGALAGRMRRGRDVFVFVRDGRVERVVDALEEGEAGVVEEAERE